MCRPIPCWKLWAWVPQTLLSALRVQLCQLSATKNNQLDHSPDRREAVPVQLGAVFPSQAYQFQLWINLKKKVQLIAQILGQQDYMFSASNRNAFKDTLSIFDTFIFSLVTYLIVLSLLLPLNSSSYGFDTYDIV